MTVDGVTEVAYYDLPQRRLGLAGLALSRRLDHGKGIWHLELPRQHAEPYVIEQVGGPVTPPPDVRRVLPAFFRNGDGPERLEEQALPEPIQADDAIGRLRSLLRRQY